MPIKDPEKRKQNKRDWYYANLEKVKESSKKSREKHKERRKLDLKKWVENNREHVAQYHKKYNKEWYKRNKESKDAQNIQWSKNNPEKVKKIKEAFKARHPDITGKYLKKYQITLKGKYRAMKGSGVKRNYSVEISFEQFCEIVSNPCTYCGENEKRIGIDRVDNTLGYTLENSAPCCTICNMMKKTMTVTNFLAHITKIHAHTV